MAFSKARRLGDLITANAEQFITSAHITDTAITGSDIHSTFDLTGKTVTVATASAGDNDTSVASTAFVQQEIASLVDSAPGTLNTLNELAAALGDDASFSTTVTNSIATKLPLAGGTLTGSLTSPQLLISGNTSVQGIQLGQDASNSTNSGRLFFTESGGSWAIFNSNDSLSFNNGGTYGSSSGTQRAYLTAAGNLNIDGTFTSGGDLTLGGDITKSGSADLNINSGGRIDLNADDNGEVRLYDGTSLYAQFKDDDNRLRIQTLISDADMLFVGNDGGSEVTAMTIDMSEGGRVGIGTGSPAGPLHVNGHTSSLGTVLEGNGGGDTVPLFFRTKANNNDVSNHGLFASAGSTGSDNFLTLGPTSTSGVKVNSSGHVDIPDQPGARLGIPSTQTISSSWTTVNFSDDDSTDGMYNKGLTLSNGDITVPTAGRYLIMARFRSEAAPFSAGSQFEISVNNAASGGSYVQRVRLYIDTAESPEYTHAPPLDSILDLVAGARFRIRAIAGGNSFQLSSSSNTVCHLSIIKLA